MIEYLISHTSGTNSLMDQPDSVAFTFYISPALDLSEFFLPSALIFQDGLQNIRTIERNETVLDRFRGIFPGYLVIGHTEPVVIDRSAL